MSLRRGALRDFVLRLFQVPTNLFEGESMPKPKADKREVLDDIRSGLADSDIMDKYDVSSHELQSLYRDLVDQGLLKRMDRFTVAPSERSISAKEVVTDIRSGMNIADLMVKHGLSMRGLQGLVTILVDTGAITRDELYGELFVEQDTALPETFRYSHRFYIDFEIPIYDAARPEAQGRIRDITEDGVGTFGLEAEVDQIKNLVVLGDALGDVSPFELEARCRWCKRHETTGECQTGFQITYISARDREELTKLIGLLTFTE
jgi:hypothetical protein